MHITRKIAKVDTTNKMTVSFDVSKDTLHYYSEITGKVSLNDFREMQYIENRISNRTKPIIKTFRKLSDFAQEHGFDGLHIVCEPTGNYSNALLHIAHRLGHTTAYVSGENVYKAKVIENHDDSKDDIKDPRVIFMLSKIGKELVYRELPPYYKALRELNRMYDAADDRRTQMRCELHHLLKRLYCDFPMSKDWVYSKSGHVLMAEYRFTLRLILGKLIFRLVRHTEIFGEYYHRRKAKDPSIPGTKIMANLERKLLRMVYAMAKRQEAFNKARYTVCESQYRKAA